MVVPGGGRVAGQEQDIGQVVTGMKVGGLEVQDGRDEHDPVQVHPISILQVSREAGGAGGTITLANQELGGRPALVARGVQANEITYRLDILLENVELLWFFTR